MLGHPGSVELPMLADSPEDFSYVLGLQKLAAVGMVNGYAQAGGRPTQFNVHPAWPPVKWSNESPRLPGRRRRQRPSHHASTDQI
jgi:hypothetical protein